jgi:hypothetical protein
MLPIDALEALDQPSDARVFGETEATEGPQVRHLEPVTNSLRRAAVDPVLDALHPIAGLDGAVCGLGVAGSGTEVQSIACALK